MTFEQTHLLLAIQAKRDLADGCAQEAAGRGSPNSEELFKSILTLSGWDDEQVISDYSENKSFEELEKIIDSFPLDEVKERFVNSLEGSVKLDVIPSKVAVNDDVDDDGVELF